ncbi:MAG: hypothetical protein RMK79_06650 [Anaerolineae bacterium]|nr:hypothetical protein [Anaerolineae bacterium]
MDDQRLRLLRRACLQVGGDLARQCLGQRIPAAAQAGAVRLEEQADGDTRFRDAQLGRLLAAGTAQRDVLQHGRFARPRFAKDGQVVVCGQHLFERLGGRCCRRRGQRGVLPPRGLGCHLIRLGGGQGGGRFAAHRFEHDIDLRQGDALIGIHIDKLRGSGQGVQIFLRRALGVRRGCHRLLSRFCCDSRWGVYARADPDATGIYTGIYTGSQMRVKSRLAGIPVRAGGWPAAGPVGELSTPGRFGRRVSPTSWPSPMTV